MEINIFQNEGLKYMKMELKNGNGAPATWGRSSVKLSIYSNYLNLLLKLIVC